MKVTLATEAGLLAVWDSKSLSHIDSENYQSNFVEDRTMVEIMNQGYAVIWGTGGDGHFNVVVRLDPKESLTKEEEGMVEMKAEGYNLLATSKSVFVGSPECVGSAENQCLQNKSAHLVEGMVPGKYSVDVYFLFDAKSSKIADEMGGVEFDRYLKENPDFDKTGYVVVLKKMDDGYKFPEITQLSKLG